jgi:hypothetical protein
MKFKKLLVAFIVLIFGVFSANAQVTLYSENFGTTASVLPTGWTSTNTTNGWNTSISSVSNTYPGFSAGANLLFNGTGTTGLVHTVTYANNLSTVGYNNITVIWGGRATAAFATPVTFQWSTDGTTWNAVTYTQVTANATWALVNGGTRITLPAGAAGVANLRFRWSAASPNNGNYRIDDFSVQGTLSGPVAALADNAPQVAAADVPVGTTNHILSTFQVTVTNATTTLNAASFTTSGNYQAADIAASGFTLWYTTTNTFSSPTSLGTLSSASAGSGETLNFTGLTQSLPVGTGYFWVTANIASGATQTRTINLNAIANTNLTFSSGTKSGSATAGGTQTITAPVFITTTNGNWFVGSTWVGGVVPSSADNVTIAHNVTNAASAANIVRNVGTTTVVNAGVGLSTGTFTYTNNGTTTINGTFTVQNGGYAGGNDFIYGPASTLVMTHASGVYYDINAGQAFWPVANPPFNVTIAANSPTRLNEAVGPVAGTLTLNNGIDIAVANALTVNGTLLMNANAFVNTNSPIYGSASLLSYRTTGTYGRGFEWLALGIGTIGTTPGYPNNVRIGNNTILNYNNGTPLAKACAGSLTIDGGSTFDMANGTPGTPGTFTIGGSVSNLGTFTFPNVDSDVVVLGNFVSSGTVNLGSVSGADLYLNGNATISGTFNGNNRAVFFTNNAATQVVSSSLNPLTIPYMVFAPASGSTNVQFTGTGTFAVSAPLGGNAISFSSAGDILDLNSETLTIGTAGVANVISGAGSFEGSTTSNLTLLGTGSIGTVKFVNDLNLGTFTMNRTAGAIGCVMGSALTVTTSLALTSGIIDLDTFTMTLESLATIASASSSNYVIADNAFGGILRKRYTATGSFTFPIGDKTGTMEYSPMTMNFTAGTFSSAYIGASVNDSKHPNMTASTHFISRYWVLSRTGTFTSPTYTFTGIYLAADVNGSPEATSQSQQWDGTVWSMVGTSPIGGNTVSQAGLTNLPTTNHHTAGYRDREINIRILTTNYLTGSTYSFANTTAGSSTSVTFTIENLGNQSLTLNGNSFTGNPPYSLSPALTYPIAIAGGSTTTFTIVFAPTATGTFTGSISFINNDSDENPYVVNFSGLGTGSATSDIIAIANSEAVTIPSTTLGAITTSTDGIQVWQFKVRDGGNNGAVASIPSDADSLPSVLTDLIITQTTGNVVDTWSAAIESVALFDGTTLVGYGIVSATEIQFTGMNLVVNDNSEKLITMRLTLKCPLGVDAVDGDDFGFWIVNNATNIVFSSSGSGRLTTAYNRPSTNSRNVIAVTATKLVFTTQPITTGVNSAMTNVVVTATDNCNNKDLNFTGNVVLTSTGTMTGSPITVAAVAGAATFTGIIHTVVGTDFTMGATATGLTGAGSTLFDISVVTVLTPGDLAVLAISTNTGVATGGPDLISFVCFRDLLPGTTLFITDNGYERSFAGLWGGTEGVITITRTGSTLPKGTIITIAANTANITSGTDYDVYTCGTIDTNWTKTAVSGGSVGGFNLNSDDDVWFMQGGVWTNDTGHSSTYTGNVLYGWTESGWNTTPGDGLCVPSGSGADGCTRWSTLFPNMECFSTVAPIGDGFVKFDDPIDPDFSTLTNGKFDWIASINNQANWDSYADATAFNTGGYNYLGGCTLVYIDTDIYINGKWSGRRDTNWFNCENWDTLVVPDETVDVLVADTTYDRRAVVDATAPFANYLNFIAKARNLTLTGEGVEVSGNINNRLEVHGNLTIANTVVDGALDMNDGNNLTADGQIYLYGNWTNNKNNNAFDEGNGTVHFVGSPTPQIINAVAPLGTEVFYNVLMDNNFTTSVSNDLVASGDLTLATGRTLTASVGDYIRVNNRLTNNGDILINDDAQLIQVNETDTNVGDYTSTATKFQVRRAFTAKHVDYVYWSAPIDNYNVTGLPSGWRYIWNPTFLNTNGTMGNWNAASGLMVRGKGYIARTFNGSATPITSTHTFRQGKPHNGQFTIQIKRGTYNGADYDADPVNATNALTTRFDDNWNLVGNPYPSAIDADEFIALNSTRIEPAIWIWRHGLGLSNTTNPYYSNFGYSYLPDYLMYNSMGSTEPSFNGKIASGQGFMVNMLHSAGTLFSSGPDTYATDLTFNNSLRLAAADAIYDNSTFFRNNNNSVNSDAGIPTEEKHRIWLDIINTTDGQVDTTLLGYSANSTLEYDSAYDCFFAPRGKVSLYSIIDQKPFIIQGRPLPFNISDQVPMGVNIVSNGNHTIAIKKTDGIFAEDVTIYLEDLALNVIHDLKQSPYSFNANKGIIDNRFIIRYTNSTLWNEEYESLANTVIVSGNNGVLSVNSIRENIKGILVYDVLGRELLNAKAVNGLSFTRGNITQSNQALIVKVTLENGVVVTKKIIL